MNQSAEDRYNVPTISFDMGVVDTYTVTFVDLYGDYKFDGVRVYNNVSDLAGTPDADAHFIKLRDKLVENFLPAIEAYNEAVKKAEQEGTEMPEPLENVAYYSDGHTGTMSIAEYVQDGPKNEIYLKKGDAVAFLVSGIDKYPSDAKFYVGLSVQHGNDDATVQLNGNDSQHVKAVTDSYYEIQVAREGKDAGVVYIKNLSDARVAVTNLKVVGVDDAAITKANAAETDYAKTLAVTEETVQPKLIVNSRLLAFVEDPEFTEAPPAVTPTPEPTANPTPAPTTEPTQEPTTEPTHQPTLQELLSQLFSSFVSNLFKSIARLFGN